MSVVRIGSMLAAAAAATCMVSASASAQLDDILSPDVLQGGFRFFDPAQDQEFAVLSLGPLVIAGGLTRRIVSPEMGNDICHDLVWILLGNEKTKRKDDKLKIKQSDKLLVFFVFSECDPDGDEICLAGASAPSLVSDCSGSIKLDTSSGTAGQVKLKCTGGINAGSESFELSEEEEAWVGAAFPDLGQTFEVKFKDDTGSQLSDDDVGEKIDDLGIDDLEDVVQAFLDDDALLPCVQ